MGYYTNILAEEVRLERMRPVEIEAAKERLPAVYVPVGSIEWHGRQNPVGLDAIKAHEQLIGLASEIGGVVYPPVFFGAGGGHTGFSHSYMVSADAMKELMLQLLRGYERDGYRKVVLLSGHYPNHSEYLRPAVEEYRAAGGTMDVLSLIENQVEGGHGDHAAKYETSYMLYLFPELVDLGELEGEGSHGRRQAGFGGPEERINWMPDEYRSHPCYGIVGIDPRVHASAEVGRVETENLIGYLKSWVTG